MDRFKHIYNKYILQAENKSPTQLFYATVGINCIYLI